MIEAIMKELAGQTSKDLTSQAGIPENLLGQLFNVTGNVATQEVTKQAVSGGLGSVMSLFSNQPNSQGADALQGNLVSGLINGYIGKLGLSAEQAKMASGIIAPMLIKLITRENSKTPETDPSPIQNLFGMGGGGSQDLKNIAGNMMGKFFKK